MKELNAIKPNLDPGDGTANLGGTGTPSITEDSFIPVLATQCAQQVTDTWHSAPYISSSYIHLPVRKPTLASSSAMTDFPQ